MILTANLEVKFRAFYKLEAFKLDGSLARSTGWFENIITNSGLDMIYNKSFLAACRCGTGTSTPVATDTSLGAQVGSTTNQLSATSAITGSSPYYSSRTVVYQFAPGTATGNISEVGVSWSGTSTDPLFSRALVLDGGGLPTTITVLSDEYLQVTYQLRKYPPVTDVTGSVTFNGVTYSTTLRATNVTDINVWSAQTPVNNGLNFLDFTGPLGAITSNPSGTTIYSATGGTGGTTGSYTNGNYYVDMTSVHPINNAGTIQSMEQYVTSWGGCQWSISPTFTITNTQQLTWVVRYRWARGSH